MVEYLRLIKGDSISNLTRNRHRPEVLIFVAVVATVIVLAYFVTRK
jgi:hypothetical protein